jgi:arylsulfatase A-like enzyme
MEQGGKRSVLQWPWKLIHLNTGGIEIKPGAKAKPPTKPMVVELYNLDADPGETTSVAEKNKATVEKLEALMTEAYREP